MAYSVVGGQRMSLTYHHTFFQVDPESAGHCRLLWVTDALPHDAAADPAENGTRNRRDQGRSRKPVTGITRSGGARNVRRVTTERTKWSGPRGSTPGTTTPETERFYMACGRCRPT
ncbi:hypothetical protein J2S42_001319 [Catenuloplanes indicus]|uniref:Uncharacterized protein n=1 Tax=Catenuloplanes indicus TaxID=137267 RepID=A0AAE4AV90_9ACTN|nr:hypothetical protein [Catenuloplanes indicus]